MHLAAIPLKVACESMSCPYAHQQFQLNSHRIQYVQCFTHESMEHSPSSKPESHSGGQKIPSLLWNLKVHYHIHKNLPLKSIMNQLNSVHTLTPYFFKLHSNTIFPSFPKPS